MQSSIQCQVIQINEIPLSINHQNMMIVFVLDGKCSVKRFSKIKNFKEGDVFFINNHEVYSITSESGCIVEWIEFDVSLLSLDEPLMRYIRLADSLGSMDQEKEMAEVYRDCVFTKNLLQLRLNKKDHSCFLEICDALRSDYHELKKDSYINEEQIHFMLSVDEWIMNNLHQKISLQQLSEQLNMKKSNLATQIKTITGMTLLERVNLHRLKKAEELLLFDDVSHQDIIKTCGFSDSKYFYRYFMEQFGMTPSAWKEKMKIHQDLRIIELDDKQAQYFILNMLSQLNGLKTETELYRKAVLLRNLENLNMIDKELILSVDLLHPDNYIEAAGERINAWYGFDMIMDLLRRKPFILELKLSMNTSIKQEEIDEIFILLKQSLLRFSSKVIKYWKFVIVVEDLNKNEEAENIRKRIKKEFENIECVMKYV